MLAVQSAGSFGNVLDNVVSTCALIMKQHIRPQVHCIQKAGLYIIIDGIPS